MFPGEGFKPAYTAFRQIHPIRDFAVDGLYSSPIQVGEEYVGNGSNYMKVLGYREIVQ